MAWYFSRDNSQQGPFSLEEIKTLIEDGTVSPSTLVWQKGMESWLAASDTELKSLLPEEAPPPLPQENPPALPVVDGGGKVRKPRIEIIRLLKDSIGYSSSVYGRILVFFVPNSVITVLIGLSSAEGSAGTTVLLSLVSFTCVIPLISGASVFYVHQNLTQQGASVADSMHKATEKFSQLALATVLVTAYFFAGLLCLIVPGVYLGVRLSFYIYAVVIENRSATDGIARSWMLTKGYWWQIFWALAALLLPLGLVGGLIGALAGDNLYLSQFISGLIGLLAGPFIAIYYVFVFMSLVNLATCNSPQGKRTLPV